MERGSRGDGQDGPAPGIAKIDRRCPDGPEGRQAGLRHLVQARARHRCGGARPSTKDGSTATATAGRRPAAARTSCCCHFAPARRHVGRSDQSAVDEQLPKPAYPRRHHHEEIMIRLPCEVTTRYYGMGSVEYLGRPRDTSIQAADRDRHQRADLHGPRDDREHQVHRADVLGVWFVDKDNKTKASPTRVGCSLRGDRHVRAFDRRCVAGPSLPCSILLYSPSLDRDGPRRPYPAIPEPRLPLMRRPARRY